MEKQIARWSYLLGVVCVVLAVLLRLADAAGLMGDIATRGATVSYNTFMKGALLFLLTAIATSNYLWMQKN